MAASEVIIKTEFPGLQLASRGKVRDIYDLDTQLLIVTTDRISAFDVVLPQGIPAKGKVLNQISAYWFEQMRDLIPNHLISTRVEDFPAVCQHYRHVLAGRSMLVRKTKPLPVECIVRGYLSGSGWKDYQSSGKVCGISLPTGLMESARLDEPIFTPSTKAELGLHDENISFGKTIELIGKERAERLRDLSVTIYSRARELAEQRGIIIADTKMEFGLLGEELILIDELLTPDSSRFWPAADYQPGHGQQSFDKQYVRDYLLSLDWNKQPPAPELPDEVVQTTSDKYVEALQRLTGNKLSV